MSVSKQTYYLYFSDPELNDIHVKKVLQEVNAPVLSRVIDELSMEASTLANKSGREETLLKTLSYLILNWRLNTNGRVVNSPSESADGNLQSLRDIEAPPPVKSDSERGPLLSGLSAEAFTHSDVEEDINDEMELDQAAFELGDINSFINTG